MGYRLAAGLFTAAEVGAPHRRERLFILAIREGDDLADPARVGYRQNALVQLAKAGAHQLGRRIPVADVDAQVLTELESDGIVRPVRPGHSVQFSHDIFFEWAFLQHLAQHRGIDVAPAQRRADHQTFQLVAFGTYYFRKIKMIFKIR